MSLIPRQNDARFPRLFLPSYHRYLSPAHHPSTFRAHCRPHRPRYYDPSPASPAHTAATTCARSARSTALAMASEACIWGSVPPLSCALIISIALALFIFRFSLGVALPRRLSRHYESLITLALRFPVSDTLPPISMYLDDSDYSDLQKDLPFLSVSSSLLPRVQRFIDRSTINTTFSMTLCSFSNCSLSFAPFSFRFLSFFASFL